MTTTHLFVELLVIGFGALIWLLILFAVIAGMDLDALRTTVDNFLTRGAASGFVILLPIAYILGILVDRLADWILGRWDVRLRASVYPEGKKFYFESRRTLVLHGGPLWEHLEYLRSRLRICRGWAFNVVLIFAILNIYWVSLIRAGKGPPLLLFAIFDVLLVLVCVLCLFSWREMNLGEYRKTRRQAEWLRSKHGQSEYEDAESEKEDRAAEVDPETKEEESSGDAS